MVLGPGGGGGKGFRVQASGLPRFAGLSRVALCCQTAWPHLACLAVRATTAHQFRTGGQLVLLLLTSSCTTAQPLHNGWSQKATAYLHPLFSTTAQPLEM